MSYSNSIILFTWCPPWKIKKKPPLIFPVTHLLKRLKSMGSNLISPGLKTGSNHPIFIVHRQRSVLQFYPILSPPGLDSYILLWKLHDFEVEGCVQAGRTALLPPWAGTDNGFHKAGVQLAKVITQWVSVDIWIAVRDTLSIWQVNLISVLLSYYHSGLRLWNKSNEKVCVCLRRLCLC